MNQVRSAFWGSRGGTAQPPLDEPQSTESPAKASSSTMATGEVQPPSSSQQPTTLSQGDIRSMKAAQERGQTVACPDPSAHASGHHALSDHASRAALLAHHGDKSKNVNPLDPDGKLSSASAATSLKHARAQDLPSFPSAGGVNASHSHGAANMAHSNRKSFEHWRPESSEAASKAALIAHDYKMDPLWQPELSEAGGRAAILAHRDGPKLNLWEPEASKEGHSAAHIAVGKKNLAPHVERGANEDQKAKALMAATSAHNDYHKKATSTPAARAGDRPVEEIDANKWDSPAMQAARIQHNHMSREMFTEHPPVEQLDKEEQRHQAALRASAISMAKKMYASQQHHIDAASGESGARAAFSQNQSVALTEDNLKTAAMQHLTLQEAAQRLAEERLAKMQTNEEAAFRDYYGYGPSRNRGSRYSIRGRKRESSDLSPEQASEPAERDRWADSDDEEQSRRIRKQMSLLRGQVADVDGKKRQSDRAALVAAAEKKVQAQMLKLDQRVYDETGKMSPAMVEEWEKNARKRLEAKHAADLARKKSQEGEVTAEKPSRVHIGGGVYMDQAEIDEIARSRIAPTLQEIDEQAQAQRARDEENRMDKNEKKRQERLSKEQEAERKADEKRARAEEKAAAKEEKEAEKARRKESKRAGKTDKDRAPAAAVVGAATAVGAAGAAAVVGTAAAVSSAVGHGASGTADATEATVAEGAAPATTVPATTAPVTTEPATTEPAATEPATTDPAPGATEDHFLSNDPEDTPAPIAHDPVSTEPMPEADFAAPTTSPKVSGDARPSASTDKPTTTSPPESPTKKEKGFKGFLSKFKRNSVKGEPGQLKGFSGGHRLSKEKKEDAAATEERPGTTSTAEEVGAAGTAGPTVAAVPHDGRDSPSISSLDESDAEDEPRGRTRESPTHQPSLQALAAEEESSAALPAPAIEAAAADPIVSPEEETAAPEDYEERPSTSAVRTSSGGEFEEARDTFDEEKLPQPQPAFTGEKEGSVASGSPHRDSKFVESL